MGNLGRGIAQLEQMWAHPDYMRRISDGVARVREPLPEQLRLAVLVRDRFTCRVCGAEQAEANLHADHLLPVAAGGTDRSDNLRTLCEPCNVRKSNLFTPDVRAVRPRLIVAVCDREARQVDDEVVVVPTQRVFCAYCTMLRSVDPAHAREYELSRWLARNPELKPVGAIRRGGLPGY